MVMIKTIEMIANGFAFSANGLMYSFLACNYTNTYIVNPNLIFKLGGKQLRALFVKKSF
jgi:hypothetical protein